MNDMKRNILLLCVLGVVVVFAYQFYLNFDKLQERIERKKLTKLENQSVVHFGDEKNHKEDDSSVALEMSKQVKVLCWVMTQSENHKTKAIHVMATWGKRCNKLFFATDSLNGRKHLTAKTMQTFDHIYKKYIDDYDWFMKADDDTYVVVENLRYFLSSQDTKQPIYFGHHFHTIVHQGYFSGGAGYVLSREALKRFGERSENLCTNDNGAEDVEIGLCMERLGVVAGDSRDSLGRSRFHCFTPLIHMTGGYPEWYYTYDLYGAKKGIAAMSDYAITFHYVDTNSMYIFDYFLFHLRPYGILNYPQDLNLAAGAAAATTLGRPVLNTSPLIAALTTTLPVQLRSAQPFITTSKDATDQEETAKLKKKKKKKRRKRRKIILESKS